MRGGWTGPGPESNGPFGQFRYHLSFWSVPYRTANGCFFQIPFMAGAGGSFVVLLPNGVSAFRFADGDDYDLESTVLAGEAIRPLCASPPAAASSPPSRPGAPHGEGARRGVAGEHVLRTRRPLLPRSQGRALRGDERGGGRREVGYCSAWNVHDGRRTRCHTVHRQGQTFEFLVDDRWSVTSFKRAPGNAEGY